EAPRAALRLATTNWERNPAPFETSRYAEKKRREPYSGSTPLQPNASGCRLSPSGGLGQRPAQRLAPQAPAHRFQGDHVGRMHVAQIDKGSPPQQKRLLLLRLGRLPDQPLRGSGPVGDLADQLLGGSARLVVHPHAHPRV